MTPQAQQILARLLAGTSLGVRAFDESDHPRDDHGRFTDSGDSGGGEKPGSEPSPSGKGTVLHSKPLPPKGPRDPIKVQIVHDPETGATKPFEVWMSYPSPYPPARKASFKTEAAALASTWWSRDRGEKDFDPNQPRDEDGKWTDGGGSSSDAAAGKVEPHVVDVGGDEWNQKTAIKLEREYQSAKPAIEKIEAAAVGESEEIGGDDEEDTVYMPEDWDSLSSDDQSEAESEYISQNKQSYYDSEVENWKNEYAPDEAKEKVADDFNNGNSSDDIEWAQDELAALREARVADGKADYPFSDKQLINALTITAPEPHSWPKKDVEINFDDDKLSEPAGFDPNQGTLPGIEPLEPHEMLTEDMREEIIGALQAAFDQRSATVADEMEPPDHLMENAEEQLSEGWDVISDSEKFYFVKNSTSILDKYEEDGGSSGAISEIHLDKLPEKYDPLNDTSGSDYRRTQALARILSRERSKQVLAERKLPLPPDHELRSIDHRLWESWKESSTSDDGKLIQLATAEELGGRLNAKTRSEINPEHARSRADRQFSSIGGYAGVKALLRAKWETTQYLLDKADLDELQLYRGLTLEKELVTKLWRLLKHAEAGRKVGSFTHLATMDVKRNGAASTTTALSVANQWGGGGSGKVVLRAVVPRTAAVSIPAYGINIKSEQEVVIAGTAWKGWDVWQGQAPGLQGTPLQKHT